MAQKQYDNSNSGALFKNEKKENDKHPDYKGQAEVNGEEYWLSGWINKITRGEREGEKMLKLAFTPKEELKGNGRNVGGKPARKNDDDDF
jgi:hypothetical protein